MMGHQRIEQRRLMGFLELGQPMMVVKKQQLKLGQQLGLRTMMVLVMIVELRSKR
jgi:hypothetical protein